MPIKSIVKTLSSSRISTYQNNNLCDGSEEQSLGLYVWNKQLSGLFYPVLQVLEISLRNAINTAYIEDKESEIESNFPPAQWEQEKSKIDLFWFKNCYTRQNNSIAYSQIQKAESDLIRDNKQITVNNLIAKLTFGFWVHMTDRNHRSNSNPASPPIIALWPKLTNKVFPFALDGNNAHLTINNISTKLFEINVLRNRIAHHEPIWKTDSIYDSDNAINNIIKQYNLCLQVIGWINPDNLKLLSIIENDKLMGIACSRHTLWRNKMLASGLATVPDISDWENKHKINTERQGIVFRVFSNNALIRCIKTNTIFHTDRNMQLRRRAWPLQQGDTVTFIPKPPTPNATRPRATRVKKP